MAEKRFLDFLDRIDGGGMGQSGDTFEGGGLLSMLGNLLASPYGSEDPERRARRDAFYAGQMGGEPMAASGFNPAPVRTASELSPARDPYDMQENRYIPRAGSSLPPELEASYTGMPAPAPSPLEMFGGQQPAPYQPQAPSPLEQFGGQQPPADDPTAEMTAKRFLADLRAAYPDRASAILNSPDALGIYQDYIRNNYSLPAL